MVLIRTAKNQKLKSSTSCQRKTERTRSQTTQAKRQPLRCIHMDIQLENTQKDKLQILKAIQYRNTIRIRHLVRTTTNYKIILTKLIRRRSSLKPKKRHNQPLEVISLVFIQTKIKSTSSTTLHSSFTMASIQRDC